MGGSALIGREHELGVLEGALDLAMEGKPQVALVEGDAGIGKSALLRAFRGAHREVTTLAWAGDDTETLLSFAMLNQLVGTAGPWTDPFTAGAALLTQLDQVASAGTVLLALDDIHLADEPSLVALNFALRRLRHDPVIAVLSARSNCVSDLPPSIARMAIEADRHLVLGGLSVAGVQQLAIEIGVGPISRRAAKRLHAATKGSPWHLTALLSEVPKEDLEQLDRPIPAPNSFAQLILTELARSSEAARSVAHAAAVLGDRSQLRDLVDVAGLDLEAGLQALDELARLRMVRVQPGSSAAVFEHPLVRAAVYGDLGPATRANLHHAAAEVLDGWASLRHRMAGTHPPDSGLACDLENWSERERQSANPSAAAEAMLAAHRMTPSGPDADRRLLAALRLFTTAGDATAAQAHAADIGELPVSGQRLSVQARIAWLTGHLDEAVDFGRQAWDSSDLKAPERDLVAAMLAQIDIIRDHANEAVTWAKRALADGRLDPVLASNTRTQRALALATSGRYREALDSLTDLPEDPQKVDTARHPELAMRGELTSMEGPHGAAQKDLAVAATLTHGDMQPFRLEAASGMGRSLFHSGDWDRGHAIFLETLALAEDMEQAWTLPFLHAQCAFVPAARGDWATADEHVTTALGYAKTSGDLAAAAYADDAAVLLATAHGDPVAVVRATERVRSTPRGSPQRDLGIFYWPAHLITALIELGHHEEAEAELNVLRRHARPGGKRTAAARLRVSGQLAAARHETERARDCFNQALAISEEYVDALERALAHEAFGRFLRRRGERRSATDQLQRALARYQGLVAVPFHDRCERELAACGLHDPETPSTQDPLTPQERVVATLICTGKTNREVAQELVLSVKTINFHLTNVYAKLDVHSRAQLVAAMHEQAPAQTRTQTQS